LKTQASYFDLPYEIEGAVLAGGTSSRMGADKAWLKLGNRSLIENIVGLLEPLFGRLRIIANEPERFGSLHIPVQRDLYPGSGPLGGIHAALSTTHSEAVFIAACDFPFLNPEFIGSLVKRLEDHDCVVPRIGGRAVPVCAAYSARCLPAVEKQIDRGSLKTVGFLNEVDTRWVTDQELKRLDPEGLALTNLNTPEDYEKAKVLVEDRPSILPYY
jgi:molybdopterin-guanine dinucleotide biosynthesis protein A